MSRGGMCPELRVFSVCEVALVKRKILLRGLLGFPLGVVLGDAIAIAISFVQGGGEYTPCTPQLVEAVGGETAAVALQTLLCGVLGTVFGAASLIWQLDRWSLAAQTGLYFAVTAAAMFSIAYAAGWMGKSTRGMAFYMLIFALIFAAVWAVQYLVMRRSVARMNRSLDSRRE